KPYRRCTTLRGASMKTARLWLAGLAAVLCLTIAAAGPQSATATVPAAAVQFPYQDPSLSPADRVNDLLPRMTLDDKVGQMTQGGRGPVTTSDIPTFRLGSVLSGGGSAPSPNTPAGWADMYDNFQRAALATPLGIPMIYGLDAVHGDNNVLG